MLEASQRYLERRGYLVDVAEDAATSYARAEERAPEVLICDWQLGEGPDGLEVARKLQARYASAVILMTGHPLDELCDAADGIDVSAALQKPVAPEVLVEAVEQAVKKVGTR